MSFLDLYQGDQQQTAAIQPNEGHDLPSGFTDNFKAAWGDGLMFSQSVARDNARAAVLGDYLDEIRQKTGNDLSKELSTDQYGVTNLGVTDFDAANARVAKLKESYPDLDLNPLSEDEINQRAVEKAQAAHRGYQALQGREKTFGGSAGSFFGSAASSAVDPVNILALAVAPETGGVSILSSALRWGALAGVSQAAIEASSDSFKEQVQPGYMESGAPIENIGGAFVGGAILGGTTKALGNLWSRVKTGQWPTSVRDAGNVIESEANVADSNPFPGAEGEVAHREALVKTIDDILAGRPIDVSGIITSDFMGRAQNLVERLQAEQPMALPVINQRAFELIAEQDRLQKRDAELQNQLFAIGPKEGYQSAADQLARVRAVEEQLANAGPGERKALSNRRDELLANTTPEKLEAAAAPIEQRRVLEAERSSIADRLDEITQEHANLQASTLPQMQLPPLGQTERIPGPRGQFEFDFRPSAEAVPDPKVNVEGPKPPTQTVDLMHEILSAKDHQDVIRGDLDRAIDANAAEGKPEIMVPGVDENGNHTMVSVNDAVDEVDAYKKLATDIQACATMREAAE